MPSVDEFIKRQQIEEAWREHTARQQPAETGVVRNYVPGKYGFIVDRIGRNVFVSETIAARAGFVPIPGQTVMFMRSKDPNGRSDYATRIFLPEES
jgi:hypothetical protein